MVKTSQIDKIYIAERWRLQRLVMRLTGNHATAEELVQDAFLRFIAGNADQDIKSCEAYLTRIARNLALNHMRHLRQGVELPCETEILEAMTDERPSTEMTLIARQTLATTLRAIMALPPRRREIFILHRFEELTYNQIAARLGISRNTVMVQIVNALADLRAAIR